MQVSVEAAIKKAWRLRWITAAIILLPLLIALIYVPVKSLNPWLIPATFAVSFTLGYAFANYTTKKWRLWAFSHVDDIHLLLKIATEDLFISNEPWNKAYKSAGYKAQWAEVKQKFESLGQINEDLLLPPFIYISKSKRKIIIQSYITMLTLTSALAIALLIIGLVAFSQSILLASGLFIFISLIIVFTEWGSLKSLFDSEMSIRIDEKGIIWNKHNFYAWEDISNETVNAYHDDGQRYYELSFIFNGEYVRIPLRGYKTGRFPMLNILQTFGIRSGMRQV